MGVMAPGMETIPASTVARITCSFVSADTIAPADAQANISTSQTETGKKMAVIVDNLSESETKRRELIKQIQELHKNGFSIRKIAQITEKERKTVKKYLEGDPDKLCQ